MLSLYLTLGRLIELCPILSQKEIEGITLSSLCGISHYAQGITQIHKHYIKGHYRESKSYHSCKDLNSY